MESSHIEKGSSFAETMNIPNSAIYDQLISEYAEKIAPEEAKYAVENL